MDRKVQRKIDQAVARHLRLMISDLIKIRDEHKLTNETVARELEAGNSMAAEWRYQNRGK